VRCAPTGAHPQQAAQVATKGRDTEMSKRKLERVGRGTPGVYALNQHAPRYADRRTRRNRSRADRKRRAIRDAEG